MIIWSNLNHPNIIRFMGYHLGHKLEVAYLISPYAPFGSIDKYVADSKASEAERVRLVGS